MLKEFEELETWDGVPTLNCTHLCSKGDFQKGSQQSKILRIYRQRTQSLQIQTQPHTSVISGRGILSYKRETRSN